MPAAIPLAIVAGAAISGAMSSSASKKAAKTQADSSNRSADLQDQQYKQTRTDQLAQLAQQREDGKPYREAGYGALSQLVGGTAPGGEFNRNFTMADYQEDPGMQFRLQQGEQGINRAATASGSRYSGATLKALARFNSGLASQEYGNAYSRFKSDTGDRFNRLSGLAGTGQTAVSQANQAGQNAYGAIGQAGMNSANQQGNALQNAGAARASGYVGQANAFNGMLGTMVNGYTQYQAMQPQGGYNHTADPSYGDSSKYNETAGQQAVDNGGWGIE